MKKGEKLSSINLKNKKPSKNKVMKNEKILHYVENSLNGKPAFVLLMSDSKEYISHGCQFIENTKENIDFLIKKFNCAEELNELFESSSINDFDLKNGAFMYLGCTSLTEAKAYPNLTNGYSMFYGCTSLTEAKEYPNLTNGYSMFRDCTSLTEVKEYPNLTIKK